MDPTVRLQLFGQMRLLAADGSHVSLGTRRGWGLLVYLVCHCERALPREDLACLFWENSPSEQARASLRQELSVLRRTLAAAGWNPIEATKDAVRFTPDGADIDVLALEAAAHDQGDPRDVLKRYQGELAHGLAIDSETFGEWLEHERNRQRELAIDLGLRAIETGDAAACDETTALVLAIDPLNEPAFRAQLRALTQSGRRSEALRRFEAFRERLRRDLDVDPSPETIGVANAIREEPSASRPPQALAQPSVSKVSAGSKGSSVRSQSQGESTRRPIQDWVPASITRSRKGPVLRVFALAAAFLIGAPLTVGGTQYAMDGGVVSGQNLLCFPLFNDMRRREPVKIGVLTPLDRSFGARQAWGAQKYVRDQRGKLDLDIQLNIRDTSEGIGGLAAILREFEVNGTHAILGPMQSRLAFDAKKWAAEVRTPVISSLASASYLARPGERDYFFRLGISDTMRAAVMFEWLQARGLQNDPYVIHEWAAQAEDEPEIYGHSQATAIKRHLKNATTIRFERGSEASQTMAADRIVNDGRAVLLFGYTSDIKRVLARMEDRGIENDVFLMGVIMEEIAKVEFKYPDRIHVVSTIVSEMRNLENSGRMRRVFEDENPDIDYDISAYYAYDAMDILSNAVLRAKDRTCFGEIDNDILTEEIRKAPNRRRKVINGGFLYDTQEVFFDSDGFKLIDGVFQPVGIGS